MSLQVWLPLNGNLDNQGISGLTFSSASISANSNGKIGSCYDNDSYSIGGMVSNETILLGNNQSMFCWVNFDSLNSASNLGGAMCGQHRYANNTGMGLTIKYISYTTGYFSINTGTGSSRTFNAYYNNTLLSAGNWYHVGYTYDGNIVRLYLNGKLDGVHTVGALSNPEDYIQVFSWSFNSSSGNNLYSNYHLDGRLNDVRIYDHCLSAKEVKEIAQGLVCHYKMDDPYIESSNYQIVDCSGYLNNGSVTDASKPEVITGSQRYSKCYEFDGVDNSILTPFNSYAKETFTLSLWFYKDSFGPKGWETLLGGPGGFELESKYSSSSTPVIYAYSWGSGSFSYDLNKWNHLVMVRTTSDTKYYLNGELKMTGTAGSIPSGNYYVGAWANASAQNYKGKISDFRIYCTALSAEDIKDLYNNSADVDKSGNLHCYELVEE